MPRIPRMPIVRRPFLVRNKMAYYDDGRFLTEKPMLMMAPDAEVLRNYMANHGFARPVHPSNIEVGEYYGPYLPGTEKLMREPGDPLNNYFERYKAPNFDYGTFSKEDYWLLQEMRREAEAKRRAREEYIDNIEWYQD